MSGAWIKGASFRRGFLDKLKDFSLSDSLKGTESRRLLVWMKNLRSGVFKRVSNLFNFINEKRLFIWGFTSLSTLYRSYHDGWLEGQRKPVHRVQFGHNSLNSETKEEPWSNPAINN